MRSSISAAAPLALTVNHLLVRKHGLILRTPVHFCFLAIRQPFFIELDEQPLRPLIIFRRGCVDLAIPVVRETEHLHLAAKVIRIRERDFLRRLPYFDGIIFRRESERIPTHRVKHFAAAHAHVARVDILGGIAFWMTHMQSRRGRIRERLELIIFRLRGIVGGLKNLLGQPFFIPLFLDLLGVVGSHR